jgi:hypothetical protein
MNTARAAAVVTGLAGAALGLATVTGPTVPDEHWGTRGSVVNALGLVVFLSMACAAEVLAPLLRSSRGGRVGLRVAQAGLLLMTLESAASQIHGGNILGPVFMLGLAGSIAGFLVLGVDGLRRSGARWLALLPLASVLVGIGAGDHGGFIVLGVAWWALGLSAPADVRGPDAVPLG